MNQFETIARTHTIETGHKTCFGQTWWECRATGCGADEKEVDNDTPRYATIPAMKNNSPTLNINMGNFQTAEKRRDAYIKAAQKEGHVSLGAWIKKHLDKIAGFKKCEN